MPLVCALAFLLASFPARNNDLWRHLAAGRDLTQGRLSPGTPLFPTADAQFNHTWLYDLLAYGLYSLLGGPGLVLGKALLVVALALVLLRLSRIGPGWLIPAVCTGLALLAMGTRLLLQPATVSYLLLALAFGLAQRRENRPSPWIPPWPLLVLFVIWANLDDWCVIGLGVVALVWLGQALDEAPAAGGRLQALLHRACSFALLAAACLVNPSHVHVFALPVELAWSGAASRSVMSPFQAAYLKALGMSPAALAYFPLLGLGLLSFALSRPRWRWQWLLPWLALAALSAWQARAVPFFAVVAGPVLAWNLQAFFARRPAPAPSQAGRRALIALRGLMVLLGLAFLVCAWPGWLQAPPFEPRRWTIDTAPSLERGALAVQRWHQEGQLGPDARGLHLSPESAAAFAWFCPEEKGVLDDRLAAAFLGIAEVPPDWAERLRAAGVNHVIVSHPDRAHLATALGGLLADPGQWPLLFLEGDLAIFGWRDPEAAGRPSLPAALNMDRLAFHPTADKKAPPELPAREPRRWWDAFRQPAPPPPNDRDEATRYLLDAEVLRQAAPIRNLVAWEFSQSAGLVGAAGGWAVPGALTDAQVRLVMLRPPLPEPGAEANSLPPLTRLALSSQRQFTRQRDDTPPALLYLAVRAARRAVAVNPDDAQAYQLLGECYLRLLRETRERDRGRQFPELAQLRRVQVVAALNRAVTLRPDFVQAQFNLGWLYRDMKILDLALHHLRAHDKLVRAAGPPPGVSAEQFRQQEAQREQDLTRLAETVQDREKSFAAESSGLRILDRVQLALNKGLAGKARDLLLASDIAAFGSQGMALELELLLRTGRPQEVRDWTTPEQIATLGEGPYYWLRAQALAASGEYAAAQDECARLARADRGQSSVNPRSVMAVLFGRAVLDQQIGLGPFWGAYRWIESFDRAGPVVRSLRQEADATTLRGLLALEQGEVAEAEAAFRLALEVWKGEAAVAAGSGLEFNGRVLAQDGLQWLEQGRSK